MSLDLARNGHPSPTAGCLLSGVKRKSASASSTSEFDPYRKSAPGNGAPDRVQCRSSTQCQIRQSSNRRTGLLAVEGPIRDDVFDLSARHADIHELPVVQAG